MVKYNGNQPEPALRPYAEKYNSSEQAWEEMPHRPGPNPVDFVAVTTVDDFLYLIGGLQLHADWSTSTVRTMQRSILITMEGKCCLPCVLLAMIQLQRM